MTSIISWPRSDLALCEPRTHFTASTTLDLPDPFGPTTIDTPRGNSNRVRSAKLLKPESSRALSMGESRVEGRDVEIRIAADVSIRNRQIRVSTFLALLREQIRQRRGDVERRVLLVGRGRRRARRPTRRWAASRSYCRPGWGRASTRNRLAQRAVVLRLLQGLDDVGIGAAQLDDRANHFVDAGGDDPLLGLGARREPADGDLAAALAVDEDVLAGVEHERQVEVLVLAEQHDFGPVAVGDVDHRRAGARRARGT